MTMTSTNRRNRAAIRSTTAVGLAAFMFVLGLTIAAVGRADSTPVGPLPPGPISAITTAPRQLVAVAMPRATIRSGLVWRLARRYDSTIVRQISEANVGRNVVLVYKIVGRGDTSLAFGLTRGDASTKAVKSVTYKIHSR